jgi:glycosyltransferase involved in cell wall biosynthesis
MKVSVITACNNSVRFICCAMESVLHQTHPEVEYLVVDGGSTDGTVDIIKSFEPAFKGRLRWISEPDQGLYDALNKGLRMSSGEIVGLLNADDFFAAPDILARVADAFLGDTVDGVFGDVRFVRDPDLSRTIRYYSSRRFAPWMLRFGFMPAHPTFYARRGVFERIGHYRTDYRISADYELLIRFFWVHRLRYRYLGFVTTKMRMGGLSTRSPLSTYILNKEIVRACRENGIYTNLPMLTFKYLLKVSELVHTNDGMPALEDGRICRTGGSPH